MTTISEAQRMVNAFNARYRIQPENVLPGPVPMPVMEFRKDLMVEELGELLDAMKSEDIVEVADAAADLLYVVLGTCSAYGIPLEPCFEEVHASNMTKDFNPVNNGLVTKPLKGKSYRKPDIEAALRMGYSK